MTKKSYKFYAGIDVAKLKLDVAISNRNGLFQVTNNEDGFRELVKQLPAKKNDVNRFRSKWWLRAVM